MANLLKKSKNKNRSDFKCFNGRPLRLLFLKIPNNLLFSKNISFPLVCFYPCDVFFTIVNLLTKAI